MKGLKGVLGGAKQRISSYRYSPLDASMLCGHGSCEQQTITTAEGRAALLALAKKQPGVKLRLVTDCELVCVGFAGEKWEVAVQLVGGI